MLQKNETRTEESRQSSHQTNGDRSEGQARRLETSSGTLGGAGGAARAASHGARAGGSGASGGSAGVHAAAAAEALALASTLLKVLLSWLGNGRQRVARDIPVGGVLGWARVGATSAVVVTAAGGVVGLGEGSLEGVVIGQLLDAVAADLDQAVVAGLLGVLVDQTTRVDAGHLGRVESTDLLELTGVGVAAVLGEEERDTVAGEVLHLLVPAGDLERRGITPGVVVEGEEVTALVICTTVHVLGHLEAVGIDVGSRVPNRNVTQVASTQVRANVTSDSLDVGSSLGRGAIVDNLVAGEEGQGVVILSEHVDGSEDVLKVDVVVRGLRIGTVQCVLGSVDIQDKVDASIGEGLHALIVVLGVVDRVHTDGVEAQVLELLDITLAASSISDRVCKLGGATGLVVDTADVEAVVALEEGVALDSNGSHAAATLLRVGWGTQDGGGAQSDGSCQRGE